MDIDSINKRHKDRLNNSNKKDNIKYFKNLISRILIAIIIVLLCIISIKLDSDNKELINKYLFDNSFNFMETKKLLEDNIGAIVPTPKTESSLVFSSSDLSKNKYELKGDKTIFEVSPNTPISTLCGGIVVFMGDKDDLGYTIIVQGNDGVDIWYSNITNSNLKLYDYIEKDTLVGESKSDQVTLKFSKEGNFLNYEEYIN